MHEYKHQLLHLITLYKRIRQNPDIDTIDRTFVFGGKAAPGYFMAKLIIKRITFVASVVNNNPDVGGRLKVVFLPNFNVKLGRRVYPMPIYPSKFQRLDWKLPAPVIRITAVISGKWSRSR